MTLTDSDDGRLRSVRFWHTLAPDEVLRALGTDKACGLSGKEARSRLDVHGDNRLPEKPPRSPWWLFIDQFKSLLILVLIGAAGLAALVGDIKDTLVILVVVLINAGLGFFQEYRAERSLAALKKMLAPEAEVRRDGVTRMIPTRELVPGDIVLLDAGDRVPADGRALAAHGLEVDESSLTGESHTVGKRSESIADPNTPLAERGNMLYLNTVVTRGRSELAVTATGADTEMGRLAAMLAAADEAPTPLQRQLDSLGKRLALIAGAVIAVMLTHGILRGEPWMAMVMTAISLSVAAIPEGLPAVVTVTLSLGLHRMARQRALVKRLAAVETLGCTSVICTDKTGTLTLNQMTARALYVHGHHFRVSGTGYTANGSIEGGAGIDLAPILMPLALCNDARVHGGQVVGDPMEGALKVLAAKGDLDSDTMLRNLPRIAEIPFDTAHKFMATFHLRGGQVRIFVKGAPDVLMARAGRFLSAHGEAPLDAVGRTELARANEALASEGLRVLGVAVSEIPAAGFDPAGDLMSQVNNLVYVGHVGLMDPPRPEATEAIRLCRQAGIQVKMITGDQKTTATAIARELGLEGAAMTSTELDALDDAELARHIDGISVFARATPEQKVRLVKVLQAYGQVVAMTGDGVNDAPALKSADIGVAMGVTGTDVAKEAATMVLTDDNFASIVHAVREGRTIYGNIVKFVCFQVSTNLGTILSVSIAPFLGLPLPFNPIQILWVNIIMDGPPAMALGVDRAHPGIMHTPPRAIGARILTPRRLGRLAVFGGIMAVGTLGLLWWADGNGNAAHATTLAFTAFVLFQVFNAFNARAGRESAFNGDFFSNRWLWLSFTGVVLLQALVVHWGPAQAIFGTTDLSLANWALAVAVASSVLVIEEARKLLGRLIAPRRTPQP
jgi:Ca2+-transporting ATPase